MAIPNISNFIVNLLQFTHFYVYCSEDELDEKEKDDKYDDKGVDQEDGLKKLIDSEEESSEEEKNEEENEEEEEKPEEKKKKEGMAAIKVYGYTSFFLYARLKNGRIMLYPPASVRPSVRPSVCKLFRFRVTPPTVYVRLS